MSPVDTSNATEQAQAMREAADRRLGIEAGWLKQKADLVEALAAERDAARKLFADSLSTMSRVITERDALRASLATARAEGVAAGALAMREAAATYVFECRLIGGGNPSSAAIRALPLPADAQAALDRVRADEREACAKIVDCGCEAWDCLLDARAAAIRARGEGGQT